MNAIGLLLIISHLVVNSVKGNYIENENVDSPKSSDLDWWQNAIFYQIFPRSFKDSDNDGIGDIQGVIQKLDHLRSSGATAVWLSPIYKSPMIDGGYDVSDYCDIAPEYGTLDDFKELVQKSQEKNMKVILDFVPNHTSDQHEWFIKSINREGKYTDYFLWADPKYDSDGNRRPPNNWLSVWDNSGWEWNEQRQQYYFHQFSSQQPDLDFHNENVQHEIKDIMTFWLDMGVDGFRIDAVPHIFEDALLRDEPLDPNSHVDPTNYNYLNHIYTKDQPETFDLVYRWREFIDNYTQAKGGDTRIFMTECATSIDKVIRYYGSADGSQLGAHFSFNFYLVGTREENRPKDIIYAVEEWLNKLPSIYTLNWLTGNHDNHRVASRVNPRNIDGYNMLLMLLPGISITYMGEEIGQEDGEVTCEQGQDPSAIKNCSTFNQTSRDFERTPFQWSTEVNAGFNDGAPTWLPVSDKYLETNLEQQINERSHYTIYKPLPDLKRVLLPYTKIRFDKSDNDVLKITRYSEDVDDEFTLAFNMGKKIRKVPIQKGVNASYRVISASVGADYNIGDVIDYKNVDLKPGDSLIAFH